MTVKEKSDKYLVKNYSREDIVLVKGKGSFLYDENGKEYIDFGAGIAVNGLGIREKKWKKAVIGQINKISHTSNLYYSKPQADLAEELCRRTGYKRAFFCNSGAEANECAIKCARKYSFDKYNKDRSDIITFVNSFHGRTIATLSATAQDSMHNFFFPFLDGFVYTEAGDFEKFKKAADKKTVCAVMTEFIQGEGGVLVQDKEFIKKVYEYCKEKDILFIADEVQTGNGRTGKLYAYENFDIKPDIITTAKGLGNGLPIGAVLMGEKVEETMGAGSHGSTFGGNPAICAGALSVLKSIDEELLKGVIEREKIIRDGLSECKCNITGMGLMLGIECKDKSYVIKECAKRGLIVLGAKNKVRLLPPLNISITVLLRGANILKEVLNSEV